MVLSIAGMLPDAGDMALSLQEMHSVVQNGGFPESALGSSQCWNGGSLETTCPRIYTLVGFINTWDFHKKMY